jgi:hypothetical protein
MLTAALFVCAGVAVAGIVPPRVVNFASLNTPALQPVPLPYNNDERRTWLITSSCCGYGPFTPAAVEAASQHYGLFHDAPCGWTAMPVVAEWVSPS